MIVNFLIAVYRANPLRPHCRPGRHVALCRWLGIADGPRCGDFDG